MIMNSGLELLDGFVEFAGSLREAIEKAVAFAFHEDGEQLAGVQRFVAPVFTNFVSSRCGAVWAVMARGDLDANKRAPA